MKKFTEEHKKKISEANKGRKFSEKTKRKIGEKSKGRKHSEETKRKMSETRKGRIVLDKTRKKISDAKKGKPTWNKNIKLSDNHKKKISESQKGEKGYWFGKGGITKLNIRLRQSAEYKLWRKSVFERDNFICQKYKISGGKLHSHHINNFADFPELRFAIDNGITLSKKAHLEFHKIYGRRNNTKEQLEEFLNCG